MLTGLVYDETETQSHYHTGSNYMTTIRRYLDVLLGLAGATAVLAAVTILTQWPYALLLAGIASIGLSMVVPKWD